MMKRTTITPQSPFLFSPLSYDEERAKKSQKAYPDTTAQKIRQDAAAEKEGSKPNKEKAN